jgi:DNA-binding NarL/FixJ family response regulator
MMLEGLRVVLEKAGIQIVGEASTGREAVELAQRLRPDIVVMDVSMPELNGIDATRRLLGELPGVRIIGLSMASDRRYVAAMLEAGALGYVLKNQASAALLLAVHAVSRGQTFVSPQLEVSDLPASPCSRKTPRPWLRVRPLTQREREVLQLLAEGKSSKEIATALAIGLPTVETHRRQIMDKLKLRSIAELTKYAVREGLTSIES